MKRVVTAIVAATAALLMTVVATVNAGPSLGFEPNHGQFHAQFEYRWRGAGIDVYLDGDGAAFVLSPEQCGVASKVVRLRPICASEVATLRAKRPLRARLNYLRGDDSTTWLRDLRTYGEVVYDDVFPGIDLLFRVDGAVPLEYDFVVRPGADAGRVAFTLSGAEAIELGPDGSLELLVGGGELSQHRPIAYQMIAGARSPVSVAYRLEADGAIGFDVGPYDEALELVIDPVVSYTTYLGGSAWDLASGIAVDGAGAVYLTGESDSDDFPAPGPSPAPAGPTDAFVAKLDPMASALEYVTFIGGSLSDLGCRIDVDASGGVVVTGVTDSTDFPTVAPAQSGFAGGRDAFVVSLDPSGSTIVYSTYLGGTGEDVGLNVALDPAGDAIVVGLTQSPDFPMLRPFQGAYGGVEDGFVSRFSSAGQLEWSTFLGGGEADSVLDVAIDPGGALLLVGDTQSSDFPTQLPLQPAGGAGDAFVSKMRPDGSGLIYSTYLGGTDWDSGQGIAVDASGDAYVTGFTWSTDFPLRAPVQATLLEGDAFVTKLSSAGDAMVYSTYLGGMYEDQATAIGVDADGSAYVSGWTDSEDFPLASPIQPIFSGVFDLFATKLTPAGDAWDWSTYLGGSDFEDSYDATVGGDGSLYIVGSSWSVDVPTTVGVVQPLPADPASFLPDGVVIKLEPSGVRLVEVTQLMAVRAPSSADVHLEWQPVVSADGYNVWRTDDKTLIRDAREPGAPPVIEAVAGCRPAAVAACTDVGAVADVTRPLLFYQIRAVRDGLEGP